MESPYEERGVKRIERSALVMHPADKMYELVNSVEYYPEFLPWCADSTVIERSETTQEARLMIKRAGVSTSFVTKNTMIPSERIEMMLKEGPFRSLNGCWTFQALTEGACKVTLNIQFEIDNPLLKSTLGKVFEQIATTMVDAFCNRADQLNKLKAQNTGTEEP